MGHKRGIPSLAAARLQRWALILSAYSYVIEFRPTKQHANADGLSRLPLGNCHGASLDCIAIEAFTVGQIQALLVTTDQVQTATREDKILSQAYHYMQHGWPQRIAEDLEPFVQRKQKLSIQGNSPFSISLKYAKHKMASCTASLGFL